MYAYQLFLNTFRYLKIVFPQVEETLLLHLLANADNNVQKATEELILLGYTKRELSPPPPPPSSSYATTATQSLPSDKRLTGSQLENANTPNSKRKAAAASASSRTKKYSEEEKLQSISFPIHFRCSKSSKIC